MTEQSTFEPGKHSSELDDLSIFNEDGGTVFESEEEPVAESVWEESARSDFRDADPDDADDSGDVEDHDSLDRLERRNGGGSLGLAAGCLLTMAGIGLMLTLSFAPSFSETLTGPLAKVGLTAMSLLLAGLMVFGFALLARRQNSLVHTIQAAHEQREHMESGLEYLVRAQEHHLDRPPASGEELDHVLICLQRQDEKLNNLTKAIKMYGKPLIEISNQASESAHNLEELNSMMARLADRIDNATRIVETLQGRIETQPSAGDFKNLLEGNRGLTSDELHKQLEGTLASQLERLESRIDESAKRVAGGVDRLLEREDKSAEPALAEIQNGLSNLASTLSALQKSVAEGVRAAPAPASPAPRQQPTHAPQSSAPSSGSSRSVGGLANSIAGAKKGSGKNVLGAIAKLKQMRN